MEQKGKEYFGRCPLHIDNTPSFSITPSKNSCYCFSCGRSGGIIGYLINFEKLSFEKAVEKASKLANLDLTKMCKSNTIAFLKKLRNCSVETNLLYKHRILPESELSKYKIEPVNEWLQEGIKQEIIDLFEIKIDSRQNRIIYPVRDIEGKLINIKGRTRFSKHKQLKIPKYINYYKVGVMDYFQSLNITIPYIQNKNEVIIFESIKSVMKAFGWGYKNCVSAEKHTLTPEQVSLLVKLKVNVVFAYDVDVDYNQGDVKKNIDKLKRVTNVFIVENKNGLLGSKDTKNAPVDLGENIWDELYRSKRKAV